MNRENPKGTTTDLRPAASQRLTHTRPFLILALAASVTMTAALWGQGTSYLTGFVTDPSQAAIADASVVITNPATGDRYDLKTTQTGVYRSPALPPGTYDVTVTTPGFQESVTKHVEVLVGQSRNLDVTMKVGAITEAVQVEASAPLLKTEDPGLGESIQYAQVSTLPYFNRSAGVLLSLAPTVRYTGEDVISYGASRYNVGAFTNVNVVVDGTSVNGDRTDVAQMVFNPSVEALQEVKVSTNQYSAQFGKDIGALVQMESKSGSNAFHGGLYGYFRNEDLDAMNAFSQTRPVDRQQMYGGTIGGPIKKNKLFFFGSVEGQTAISPAGVALTVPTAAEKSGDFSALSTPIYNPATTGTDPATGRTIRDPFPGNIIPASLFDSASLKALKYIPDPGLGGILSNNLLTSTGTNLTKYRSVNRVDWNISDNDRLFGNYMLDHTLNENLGVPAYNALSPAASPTLSGFGFQFMTQSYSFTELHNFSPSFFMSNRFAYRPRYIQRSNPAIDPAAQWADKLGIKNYAGANLPASYGGDLGFPTYNFTGYTGLGPGSLQFQENPIKELSYDLDLTYVHGAHTLRFGFQFEHGQHGAPDQSFPTGNFNFGPIETSLPGVAKTGNAFASFLLGQVDSASTELGPLLTWHNNYYGSYVQDDWKVTSTLTINLGMRWDIDGPVYESQYRGNSFDFYATNPVSGTPGVVEFLNRPGYPQKGFYNTDYKRLAPRAGFAWQALPRTVIRGGYGIYNINPTLGANRRAPSLGFTTLANFSSSDGGVTSAFTLQNGFPSYPLGGNQTLLTPGFGSVAVGKTPTTSPTFVSPDWRMGYVQNFNLSIERELPWSMVLEIAGQSSLGRRLSVDNFNWNEVPPQYWGISGANNARRPFPQYGNVTQIKDAVGSTNYWNGYIKLDKHFSKGLTMIANYSFGRNLGWLSGSVYYPRLTYGPVVFDEANGVTAIPYQTALISFAYELPFGQGKPFLSGGIGAKVFGGWSIGGVLSLQGGVPFTVTASNDSLNGNSPLSNRVNVVGNPTVSNPTPSHWFNTSAFVLPAFGQIGSFRSFLLGPADRRLDLSIHKVIPIRERLRFSLVGEFFNFTNSPQFGPPDSNLGDPTFGQTNGPGGGLGANTLGPYGGRQVQLGGRIDF
jgi:hypothetical protein